MITQKMQFVPLNEDKVIVPLRLIWPGRKYSTYFTTQAHTTPNPMGLIHISLHRICTVQGQEYMKFSKEFTCITRRKEHAWFNNFLGSESHRIELTYHFTWLFFDLVNEVSVIGTCFPFSSGFYHRHPGVNLEQTGDAILHAFSSMKLN